MYKDRHLIYLFKAKCKVYKRLEEQNYLYKQFIPAKKEPVKGLTFFY